MSTHASLRNHPHYKWSLHCLPSAGSTRAWRSRGPCPPGVHGKLHNLPIAHLCRAIGTRNYPCFYTLAVVGTLKYLFTVVLGVMLVTTIPPEGLETEPWYLSVMTLYILASMACAIAFLSLCGFQTYLQACWGVGTLDWLTKRWQATVAQRHTPASTVHSQPRTTTSSSPSTGTATVVHVAASTAAANSHTVAGNSTSTSQKAPRAPSRPTSRRIASPDTAMMASVIAEETEESGGEESVVEGGGWAEAAPASEPAGQGTETVQEEEEAESEESERESESDAPLASGSPPAGPESAAATPSHDSDGDEPPDAVCLDKAGSDEGREDDQGGEAGDASATDGETRPPGPPPSPVPHTTPASPPQPQPQ